MSTRTRLVVFVTVFIAWTIGLGLWPGFSRWFIESLTVPVAAAFINALGLAAETVTASGSRLQATGGGGVAPTVRNCAGVEPCSASSIQEFEPSHSDDSAVTVDRKFSGPV